MKLLRPLLLLALVVGCLVAVYVSPLGEVLRPAHYGDLRARIEGWGPWAPLLFVLVTAGGIGVGAPRLAFAALGGLAFHWWEGFLLAQAGTFLGCLLNFGWARWLGRSWVERRVGRRLGRLLDKVGRRPIATNVMLRVCPVGNNFLVNLFFGISPVSARDFAIGTFVGTAPETLIYAIFGSSAHDASTRLLVTGGALLAALTIFYWVWSRRSRDLAEVAEDLSDDGADAAPPVAEGEPAGLRRGQSSPASASSIPAAPSGAPTSKAADR